MFASAFWSLAMVHSWVSVCVCLHVCTLERTVSEQFGWHVVCCGAQCVFVSATYIFWRCRMHVSPHTRVIIMCVFLCVSSCSRGAFSSGFSAGNNMLAMGEWQGKLDSGQCDLCVCVWFVCVQISLCVCACVCFCPLTPPCIPPILSLLVKNILRHKTTGESWAEECLHQRPLTLWYSLSMLHVEKHNFLSECEVKEAKREKLHLKTPYCDVKGKILKLNKPPNSDSNFFLNLFVFQGAVRGIHEPLGQLCFKFGQPCPLWEQQPVAGHAVGGAAEAPSSGAIVWSFQGRPGSHEVVETLLQVSQRVQKVAERSRGVTLLRYCAMFHSLSQALCLLREVLYYYSS